MIKACLFDLDGTLIDSLNDLSSCLNEVLTQHHYPTHSIEQYAAFIGHGVRTLVSRAMPYHASEAEKEHIFDIFTAYYAQHCLRYTTIYQDIEAMLQTLQQHGIKLGVVTNKETVLAQKMVAHLFESISFELVYGMEAGRQGKPHPAIVLDALAHLGLQDEEVIMIGDSEVDIETGHGAGIKVIGVTWGFRTAAQLKAAHADHIVDQALDIVSLII